MESNSMYKIMGKKYLHLHCSKYFKARMIYKSKIGPEIPVSRDQMTFKLEDMFRLVLLQFSIHQI